MTRLPDVRRPDYQPTYRVEPKLPEVFYLCHFCGNLARYPREKKYTFRFPFGYTWTVVYELPRVCMTCRMSRSKEELRLRGGGRYRFWKRFFAVYLGERYPSMEPWMHRLVDWRLRYLGRRMTRHA